MITSAQNEIREFIQNRMPSLDLRDDEDIFSLSFVNSLFAMELVMFIEKAFALSIPNEEIDIDNFRTINAMMSLVGRLTRPVVNGALAS
jgi:methoxymalonate biosynthesis acyl carrier protein